jgi:hypothetical protein
VFEDQRAYVTMPDGSLLTLRRLNTGSDPEQPRTFSDGRVTFVQENERVGRPRVLFCPWTDGPGSMRTATLND